MTEHQRTITLTGGPGDDEISANYHYHHILPEDIRLGNEDLEYELYGYGGDDRLISESRWPNRLYGGPGNDFLFGGGGGDDELYGGPGDDFLHGGMGADILDGGPGSDTISYSNWLPFTIPLSINLSTGQVSGGGSVNLGFETAGDVIRNVENIYAGSGHDTLTGDANSNRIHGDLGNDLLYGYGGDDWLDGGEGADRLYGGRGNDWLTGGEGRDYLESGYGADRLTGGPGADIFSVTDGDVITDFDPDGGDWIQLGVFFSSGEPRLGDVLDADGDGRRDDREIILPAGENLTLLDVGNATIRIGGRIITEAGPTGGEGDDRPTGGEGDDQLTGGEGNDDLRGYGGDDVLTGGAGDDRLAGMAGVDDLAGGPGDDTSYGGTGDDRQTGGDGNDRLYGGPGDDEQAGGTGNDRLSGGTENDRLYGGAGNDEGYGGAGDDQLYGNDGDDQLYGGPGADVINGGAGDDLLSGGPGDDQLTGGPGADTFRFLPGHSSGGEGDVITDFDYAAGDRLSGFSSGGATLSDVLDADADGASDDREITLPDGGEIALLDVGNADFSIENIII